MASTGDSAAASAAPVPLSLTGPTEEKWDSAWCTERLAAEDYGILVKYVLNALEKDREPRAVNWTFCQGYKKGHAFGLYLVTRNLLKPMEGRVSAVEDIHFGFKCAVLLMLRAYQDVKAAKIDMAKDGLEPVYTSLRDKTWRWVAAHDNKPTTPPISKIHTEVSTWVRENGGSGRGNGSGSGGGAGTGAASVSREYPMPTWCTAFGIPYMGWTFSWNTPATYDIEAFKRSKGIPVTREEVTGVFLHALAQAKTWKDVFSIPLL